MAGDVSSPLEHSLGKSVSVPGCTCMVMSRAWGTLKTGAKTFLGGLLPPPVAPKDGSVGAWRIPVLLPAEFTLIPGLGKFHVKRVWFKKKKKKAKNLST